MPEIRSHRLGRSLALAPGPAPVGDSRARVRGRVPVPILRVVNPSVNRSRVSTAYGH
jgi:hypothetical protein